ncbi:MAG TPA: signal peptidase I [Acidimicrobiales bacterium]|nr:signal peptidase I [Acidimicrobiales bacterium]
MTRVDESADVGVTETVDAQMAASGTGALLAPENTKGPAALRTPESTRRPDYRLRGIDVASGRPEPDKPRPTSRNLPRRRRFRRLTATWLLVLAVAVLVGVVLRLTVVQPYTVTSAAMTPTLQSGDRTLVVTWSALNGGISRGSLVVVKTPDVLVCRSDGNGQDLALRVIGLPGETISSSERTIYVNGRPLSEPGWYNQRYGPLNGVPISPTKVPQGQYFVLGDNRSNLCDSRVIGPVAASSVVGKVMAIDYRDGHPHLHLF